MNWDSWSYSRLDESVCETAFELSQVTFRKRHQGGSSRVAVTLTKSHFPSFSLEGLQVRHPLSSCPLSQASHHHVTGPRTCTAVSGHAPSGPAARSHMRFEFEISEILSFSNTQAIVRCSGPLVVRSALTQALPL